MNYLSGQDQLFVAIQMYNWTYGQAAAFRRQNHIFRHRAVAFFWED